MSAGSLSDRLKSLGVQLGAAGISPVKPEKYPIESVMNGNLEITARGEVFYTHKVLEHDYRHGGIPLNSDFSFPIHTRWARTREGNLSPYDLVFLDTETTGLAGGTGTLVFLVGLGYFAQDGFHLVQLFLRTPSDAPAFLDYLGKIAAPFKALSTYNGKAFDVPVLNSQCVLNRFPPFLKDKDHFDLLPLARRLWSNRLPSRALKDIEDGILGVKRSSEEIPGWMIPEMYIDYLRSGDSRPLSGVFYHNEVDILSLAGLFVHTARLLEKPGAVPDLPLVDIYSIARLYEDLGEVEQAYILYDHCYRNRIEGEFLLKAIHQMAVFHRRRGEWDRAADLWKAGAGMDDSAACIELAKYYEHIVKDYQTAREWTRKSALLRGIERNNAPSADSIEHRQTRLEKKMGSTPEGK